MFVLFLCMTNYEKIFIIGLSQIAQQFHAFDLYRDHSCAMSSNTIESYAN